MTVEMMLTIWTAFNIRRVLIPMCARCVWTCNCHQAATPYSYQYMQCTTTIYLFSGICTVLQSDVIVTSKMRCCHCTQLVYILKLCWCRHRDSSSWTNNNIAVTSHVSCGPKLFTEGLATYVASPDCQFPRSCNTMKQKHYGRVHEPSSS